MKEFYRTYLKNFDGEISTETKTILHDKSAALKDFTDLVNRSDLDGQKYAAVLTKNNKHLAYHRFDTSAGNSNYWRDRLEEINWDLS